MSGEKFREMLKNTPMEVIGKDCPQPTFPKKELGCAKCGNLFILADTEDWNNPVCYDCWEAMGEPEHEPTE